MVKTTKDTTESKSQARFALFNNSLRMTYTFSLTFLPNKPAGFKIKIKINIM